MESKHIQGEERIISAFCVLLITPDTYVSKKIAGSNVKKEQE